MTYIPHDYWMICQRTGLKFRRSEMRQEWTGQWVHKDVWNPRHPQDYVKSITEDPSVFPSFPDVEQVIGETTLNGGHTKFAKSITLTAISGLVEDDPIGIVLDNGTVHWSFLTADPIGSVAIIREGIPYAAASGNVVYLPSLNNESWQ
jgi:hypothetical protein